jgi:hypothetical protein
MIIFALLKGISPGSFLAQSDGTAAAQIRANTVTATTGNRRKKDDTANDLKPKLPVLQPGLQFDFIRIPLLRKYS